MFCTTLNLSACTRLHSLALHFTPGPFHMTPLSWRSLTRLVASAPHATLTALRLHTHASAVLHNAAHPWNPLDGVLCRFPALRTVVFVFDDVPAVGGTEELVRGCFPRVVQSGVGIEFEDV